MADYLTTDTELTSIANAIRTKGGTSEQLTYPGGFVTAIGNINTGGEDECLVLYVAVSHTDSQTATFYDERITSSSYVFNTGNTELPADMTWTTGSGYITVTFTSQHPEMYLFICLN